jgi:excisionase family DNA binding protein
VADKSLSTKQAAEMLGVTAPTVRHMLKDGRLAGCTEPNGSRFRWLVTRESVEALRAKRDARDQARRGDRVSVIQLRDEIAELRNELRTLAPGVRRAGDSPTDAGALHEALLQQRALMGAWQAADLARAEMVQHLLEALAAGERADSNRRDALAAANTIIGQFVLPVGPPK